MVQLWAPCLGADLELLGDERWWTGKGHELCTPPRLIPVIQCPFIVFSVVIDLPLLAGHMATQKKDYRASLVAQWLRICLPMQGTRVRALVWEDPTCRGATRPVSHNY